MHSDVATLSKTGIWREVYRILNEEGVRAFWRGNMVTIIHRLPYSSISFYAYEHYKNVYVKVFKLVLFLFTQKTHQSLGAAIADGSWS